MKFDYEQDLTTLSDNELREWSYEALSSCEAVYKITTDMLDEYATRLEAAKLALSELQHNIRTGATKPTKGETK